MKPIAPKVKCADGVELSVQASKYHYCSPREDAGPHSCVEVGYIEKGGEIVTPPDDWREHTDGPDFPNSVYAYVPIKKVEDFIAAHGGRVSA